jgi:hypothetical protein
MVTIDAEGEQAVCKANRQLAIIVDYAVCAVSFGQRMCLVD